MNHATGRAAAHAARLRRGRRGPGRLSAPRHRDVGRHGCAPPRGAPAWAGSRSPPRTTSPRTSSQAQPAGGARTDAPGRRAG
ncbi:hypothetical protein QJS66_15590 [Kocuria rhizophila]|nr:hypothetical protein QJS66_15590 [Kocuria rhizophila]